MDFIWLVILIIVFGGVICVLGLCVGFILVKIDLG